MRRAFTLVELVVALLIVALMTHLAVRETAHLVEARRAEAAARQVETLREAAAAFLGDTGRLPKKPQELWERPADIIAYRVVATNDVASSPMYFVPTGWRGPYVKLPPGKKSLYDPYGNDLDLTSVTNGLRATGRLIVTADAASEALPLALALYLPDGSGGVKVVEQSAATSATFADVPPGLRILATEKGQRPVTVAPDGETLVHLYGENLMLTP